MTTLNAPIQIPEDMDLVFAQVTEKLEKLVEADMLSTVIKMQLDLDSMLTSK